MKLEKYGIVLNRLTHDKIEMVRNWRNDPKIAKYMEYKDFITPEMQEKWFQKIDNDNNFYFIIEYGGKEIGLINVKNIDYNQKTGEGGIFIYDDEYLNTTIPFQISLCLSDFYFEILNLDKLICHILKDNKRAIKFNKMLGFKICENQENINHQKYILYPEIYYKCRDRILSIIY